MSNPMRPALHAAYLRMDSNSKSLSKIALAQVLLKILYSYEQSISYKQIEKNLFDCLHTKIMKKRILESLDLLIKDNIIDLLNEKI